VVPTRAPRRPRDRRFDVEIRARVLGPRYQLGRYGQERCAQRGVGCWHPTTWHGRSLWRDRRRVGPERAVPRHRRERLDTHGTVPTGFLLRDSVSYLPLSSRAADRKWVRDLGLPRTGDREAAAGPIQAVSVAATAAVVADERAEADDPEKPAGVLAHV
jgi:hypothetical protein